MLVIVLKQLESSCLRHVHVIEEQDETFAGWRTIDLLGPFLDVCLDVALDIQ